MMKCARRGIDVCRVVRMRVSWMRHMEDTPGELVCGQCHDIMSTGRIETHPPRHGWSIHSDGMERRVFWPSGLGHVEGAGVGHVSPGVDQGEGSAFGSSPGLSFCFCTFGAGYFLVG